MKMLTLGLVLLGFASSTFATDKVQLDNRIRTLTGKFEELQVKPDKCVPADNLRKAQGIILLDRTKAGLVFGYQGGGGVALVKDPKTAKWSAAGFMGAKEGSLILRRRDHQRRHDVAGRGGQSGVLPAVRDHEGDSVRGQGQAYGGRHGVGEETDGVFPESEEIAAPRTAPVETGCFSPERRVFSQARLCNLQIIPAATCVMQIAAVAVGLFLHANSSLPVPTKSARSALEKPGLAGGSRSGTTIESNLRAPGCTPS